LQEITKLQQLLSNFFAYCKLINEGSHASKLDLVFYFDNLNKNIVALNEELVTWNCSNLNDTYSDRILNVMNLAKRLITLNTDLAFELRANHAPLKQFQKNVVLSSFAALAMLESLVAYTFLKNKWQPTLDLTALTASYVRMLENLNLSYLQSTNGRTKLHEFYELGLVLYQNLPTLQNKNYWLTESYLQHLNQQSLRKIEVKLSLLSKLSTWWWQAEAENDYDSLLQIINLIKAPQLQFTTQLINNLNKKQLLLLAHMLQLETNTTTSALIDLGILAIKQLISTFEMKSMSYHNEVVV
jgi:hypothetical protein